MCRVDIARPPMVGFLLRAMVLHVASRCFQGVFCLGFGSGVVEDSDRAL